MANETAISNGEIDGKKAILEQQYIVLLEQRVAQLQRLIETPADSKNVANSVGNIESNPSVDETIKESTTQTPFAKESLDQAPDIIAKSPQAPPNGKGRVCQVVSKYNEKSGLREDMPIEEAVAKNNAVETSCFLRSVMDPANTILYNEIDLGPGPLLDLLREGMPQDPIFQSRTNTPQPRVILCSPFMPLIYNWDKLKEAEKVTANDTSERREARADLGKLLEYVQNSEKLEPYFKNRASNISSDVVSFEYLWTIFPSGAEVIATTFLDEQQILIVDHPPFAVDNEKKLSLWCWYYDHDGIKFFPAMIEFKIERFQGTKPITSLPCYPLRHYEKKDQKIDGDDLRTWLIKRGKDFHHFCTTVKGAKRMCDYKEQFLSVEGYIMSQDMDDRSGYRTFERLRREAQKKARGDEKIIIDPEAFLEYGN